MFAAEVIVQGWFGYSGGVYDLLNTDGVVPAFEKRVRAEFMIS